MLVNEKNLSLECAKPLSEGVLIPALYKEMRLVWKTRVRAVQMVYLTVIIEIRVMSWIEYHHHHHYYCPYYFCLYYLFRTKETLASGNFLSVINVLMQLRKVCNHPNLFEARPTVSPFMMEGIHYEVPSVIWGITDYDPLKVNIILLMLSHHLHFASLFNHPQTIFICHYIYFLLLSLFCIHFFFNFNFIIELLWSVS